MKKLTVFMGLGALFAMLVSISAILIPAPPALALWLVDEHVDFFEKPYPQWAENKSVFDRFIVRAAAYKLSQDWVTRTVDEVSRHGSEGIADKIITARDQLNKLYINQRQIWHTPIDLPTYARLVYGMAWCDGQNHLFSMILGEIFGEAHTLALRDEVNKQSVHVAVQLDIDGAPVIADAWSDVPVFVMDENRNESTAGIPVWSDVSSKIVLQRLDGASTDRAAMAREYYLDGELRIRSASKLIPFGYFIVQEERVSLPNPRSSSLQTYLKARVFTCLE